MAHGVEAADLHPKLEGAAGGKRCLLLLLEHGCSCVQADPLLVKCVDERDGVASRKRVTGPQDQHQFVLSEVPHFQSMRVRTFDKSTDVRSSFSQGRDHQFGYLFLDLDLGVRVQLGILCQ